MIDLRTKLIAWAMVVMAAALVSVVSPAGARTVQFSGYTWEVRPPEVGGPGPNHWNPDNVWVDARGRLHLKIARHGAQWQAAEIYTQQRFGFGRYEFTVHGPIDRLDPNVVLGLFDYPTADVGGDGTNEIDIEFSRWGDFANDIGNFTVYPAYVGTHQASKTFPLTLHGSDSVQQFTWQSQSVAFDSQGPASPWTFQPTDYRRRVPQRPLPVHINLWLFQGKPPTDGHEVEIVINRFTFVPMPSVGIKQQAPQTP